tara:strand:- start:5708 stop:5926 length:219 start_codon:yes stop_codon:yes gene_type:complete
MTVAEHINTLIQIVKNRPEVADFECIYSTDDEGNSHHKVLYTPTIMKVESFDNQYIEIEDCKQTEGNALCIN